MFSGTTVSIPCFGTDYISYSWSHIRKDKSIIVSNIELFTGQSLVYSQGSRKPTLLPFTGLYDWGC